MSKAFTRKKLKFYDRLCRDRRLKGMAPCVAWRILSRISVEGGHSWPGLETLAAELDCNEKTVRRANEALEENGWFDIKHGGGGRKKVNLYWPNYGNRADLSTLGAKKTGQDCPLKPDNPVPENRAKVSNESFKESFKEPPSGSVPSPLKGGAAPLSISLGDTSLEAGSDCLHGLAATYIPREDDNAEAADMHLLLLDGLRAAGFGDKEAWEFLLENLLPEELAA